MCKVKQIECIVKLIRSKSWPYVFFKKITVHTNAQKIQNLEAEIYKFPNSQIMFSRYINGYSWPRMKQ